MLRPSYRWASPLASRWATPLACLIAAALPAILPTLAPAQTVRFLTSVGAFDMQLNPTNNPNLQGHVDNILAYVGTGRYHAGVINRAADNFVLQLGGFQSGGFEPNEVPLGGFQAVDKFNDLIVDANNDGNVDFDVTGLTNTPGTVSLALAAGDANSGTSSFFVNISDNAGSLDPQDFVPFAEVSNMATINRIMALDKVDLSNQVGQSGSLAYIDVPVTDDGRLVVIESVMVVSQSNISFEGPVRFAAGLPESPLSANASVISDSGSAAPSNPAPGSPDHMPEPAAALLGLIAGLGAAMRRRSR